MVVVTQHPALVEYLEEKGIIPKGVDVIPHATADDVRDKHVVGVLPLHLAALTSRITSVTLLLPKELRGVELTKEQVKQYATKPETYEVKKIDYEPGDLSF